jgi:hypothetical protein
MIHHRINNKQTTNIAKDGATSFSSPMLFSSNKHLALTWSITPAITIIYPLKQMFCAFCTFTTFKNATVTLELDEGKLEIIDLTLSIDVRVSGFI